MCLYCIRFVPHPLGTVQLKSASCSIQNAGRYVAASFPRGREPTVRLCRASIFRCHGFAPSRERRCGALAGGRLPSKLRRHAFFGLEQTQPPDLGRQCPPPSAPLARLERQRVAVPRGGAATASMSLRREGWLERARLDMGAEALDGVALLEVVVVLEGHAAFLANRHFLHLVLEALER